MLFDLSMTELMLIGVVALVVIGPKDLPKALRVAGYWFRKARTLSREFQSSVEQMIREAELDEVRQELKKATEIDLNKEFHQTIDPSGSLAESLKPPELPKLFEAEPPPAPAMETQSHSPPEPAQVEAKPPPPDMSQAGGEKAVAPADPRNGPLEPAVQGGAQGSDEGSPSSGFPPARE
jgi:sec-independent protein translocase protein TatB